MSTVEFNKLPQVERAIINAQRKALTEGAIIIEGDATLRAPVDTGNLRGSITHGMVSDTEAWIGTNVEYAARIEYGFNGTDALGRHYRQPPQSYLRTAFDGNKDSVQRRISDTIAQAIRGVV